MSEGRKDGKSIYRGIEFSFSAYGENGKYSGSATIPIHESSHTTDVMLELDRSFETLLEAEKRIINSAKKWIDNHIG